MTTLVELLLPIALAVAYARRVSHLAEHGNAPSTLRQISFSAGLLLLLIATVGPMDELADELVFGHMIQHTILTDEAALLLAIGLTGPVLRPVLSAPGLRHLRGLVHPVVAIVPVDPRDLRLAHPGRSTSPPAEHPLLHLLEHASFLGAGLVMWLALLGPLPKPQWFGHIGEGRLHRGRLLLEHGDGEHPHVVGRRALPALRRGRGGARHLPPHRSEPRRGDPDDPGRRDHARRSSSGS